MSDSAKGDAMVDKLTKSIPEIIASDRERSLNDSLQRLRDQLKLITDSRDAWREAAMAYKQLAESPRERFGL